LKPFESLNAELAGRGEKTYVNPRNAAAGALRQLDSRLTAQRPIDLLCYAIVAWEGEGRPATQWETLQVLKAFGFPVSRDVQKAGTIQEAIQICADWELRRNALDYEVDGAVIKLDDLHLSDELGYVGKDPRGSVAYKFPAREVSTVLQDIGVNVGRTGVLTPLGILEPVSIGGVTVSRATLHNFDFIRERDIRIGDVIMIKRAGDVIPYVIGPIPDKRTGREKPFSPPKQCPSCHEPVQNIPGEVALYCNNASCPAQLIRNIEHFASRSAMDIEGLGIRIIEQLVQERLVKNLTDLYQLKNENLLQLEGFADKKAENLIRAIGESKTRSLPRLLTGLGIHGVGEVLAVDLARQYRCLDKFSNLSSEELQTISGVGPNLAESILDWFARKPNRSLLEKFRKLGIWPEYHSPENATGAFTGIQFVVTGTLEHYSRETIKTFIQQQGGKVQESVSRKTDYLVAGENPGSKFAKAKSLGIPILGERELERWAQSKEKPA
jgi:DNA ligase (NAD+)